jgi:hypothetical protein
LSATFSVTGQVVDVRTITRDDGTLAYGVTLRTSSGIALVPFWTNGDRADGYTPSFGDTGTFVVTVRAASDRRTNAPRLTGSLGSFTRATPAV